MKFVQLIIRMSSNTLIHCRRSIGGHWRQLAGNNVYVDVLVHNSYQVDKLVVLNVLKKELKGDGWHADMVLVAEVEFGNAVVLDVVG